MHFGVRENPGRRDNLDYDNDNDNDNGAAALSTGLGPDGAFAPSATSLSKPAPIRGITTAPGVVP